MALSLTHVRPTSPRQFRTLLPLMGSPKQPARMGSQVRRPPPGAHGPSVGILCRMHPSFSGDRIPVTKVPSTPGTEVRGRGQVSLSFHKLPPNARSPRVWPPALRYNPPGQIKSQGMQSRPAPHRTAPTEDTVLAVLFLSISQKEQPRAQTLVSFKSLHSGLQIFLIRFPNNFK